MLHKLSASGGCGCGGHGDGGDKGAGSGSGKRRVQQKEELQSHQIPTLQNKNVAKCSTSPHGNRKQTLSGY